MQQRMLLAAEHFPLHQLVEPFIQAFFAECFGQLRQRNAIAACADIKHQRHRFTVFRERFASVCRILSIPDFLPDIAPGRDKQAEDIITGAEIFIAHPEDQADLFFRDNRFIIDKLSDGLFAFRCIVRTAAQDQRLHQPVAAAKRNQDPHPCQHCFHHAKPPPFLRSRRFSRGSLLCFFRFF